MIYVLRRREEKGRDVQSDWCPQKMCNTHLHTHTHTLELRTEPSWVHLICGCNTLESRLMHCSKGKKEQAHQIRESLKLEEGQWLPILLLPFSLSSKWITETATSLHFPSTAQHVTKHDGGWCSVGVDWSLQLLYLTSGESVCPRNTSRKPQSTLLFIN